MQRIEPSYNFDTVVNFLLLVACSECFWMIDSAAFTEDINQWVLPGIYQENIKVFKMLEKRGCRKIQDPCLISDGFQDSQNR